MEPIDSEESFESDNEIEMDMESDEEIDIEFEVDRPGLPEEVHFDIFNNLDLEDLGNISLTSRNINRLATDDIFWKNKVKSEYGENIMKMKPANISYRQQYQDLHNPHAFESAVERQRLDLFVTFYKNKDQEELEDILYDAAEKGWIQLFEWLLQNEIAFDHTIANGAIFSTKLDMLNWFARHNIYPNEDAVGHAIENDLLSALVWLSDHGFEIMPNMLNIAASDGSHKVFEWLLNRNRNRRPTQETFVNAVMGQSSQILELLKPYEFELTTEMLDWAVHNNNYNAVKWILNRNITPTQETFARAVMGQSRPILKLLEPYEFEPNSEMFYDAVDTNNYNAVGWILNRADFILRNDIIMNAIRNDHVRIIQILYRYIPEQILRSIENLIHNNAFNSLRWVINQLIVRKDINNLRQAIEVIIDNDDLNSLLWAIGRGMALTNKMLIRMVDAGRHLMLNKVLSLAIRNNKLGALEYMLRYNRAWVHHDLYWYAFELGNIAAIELLARKGVNLPQNYKYIIQQLNNHTIPQVPPDFRIEITRLHNINDPDALYNLGQEIFRILRRYGYF